MTVILGSDPHVPPPDTKHFPFLVCHTLPMCHILIRLQCIYACVTQLLIMQISECLCKHRCWEYESSIHICSCGNYPLGRIIFCLSYAEYNKALQISLNMRHELKLHQVKCFLISFWPFCHLKMLHGLNAILKMLSLHFNHMDIFSCGYFPLITFKN